MQFVITLIIGTMLVSMIAGLIIGLCSGRWLINEAKKAEADIAAAAHVVNHNFQNLHARLVALEQEFERELVEMAESELPN